MHNSLFIPQPRISEMMKAAEEGKPIKDILSQVSAEAQAAGNDRMWAQVSHRFKDYDKRCDFIQELGMKFYQEKTAFILNTFNKALLPPFSLSFVTAGGIGIEALADLTAQTLESPLDREDRENIARNGLASVAKQMVEDKNDSVNGSASWWQIGMHGSVAVGLVFPVKFDGCEKDGLIEGSIKYYGVLPKFRGRGFGKELLHRGCELLNDIGMWRIFNDVDSENTPSIKAFRSNGHREVDKIAKYQAFI
jgi:ribosomal protein S18 acetylase RimI-like enzyme